MVVILKRELFTNILLFEKMFNPHDNGHKKICQASDCCNLQMNNLNGVFFSPKCKLNQLNISAFECVIMNSMLPVKH